jgi:glycosyltransferase involved in cell wall biosynthesis
VAGNEVLREYCDRFGRPVLVAPTPIDPPARPRPTAREDSPVVIGWIGHPDGLAFLKMIEPALQQVSARLPGRVLLRICTAPAPIRIEGIPVHAVPWSLEGESEALRSFDIGIMPLSDDGWSRGKCAYKALQYMGAGIAPVVSPVGMNREIIREGVTGYYARDHREWVERLSDLASNAALRESVGSAARDYALSHFSRDSVFERIRNFFDSLVDGTAGS